MPPATKQFDFNKLLGEGDVKVDVQVKTAEDEFEKRLRLRKDFLSFLAKEIAPILLAMLSVLVIGGYCLVVLMRSASTPDERQWARSIISAILGLVVGVVTGKGIK